MLLSLCYSKLWWSFWIIAAAFSSKNVVYCSGKAGSEGGTFSGLFSYVSSIASSVFSSRVDHDVNYGKLLNFERNLHEKFKEMGAALTRNPSIIQENTRIPIKFPEASAFSALFIRDIGGHLDTWMDLSESKKLHENSKIISQHILWVRSVGSKAATSYFIYRPSFEAELESSDILPHIQYHNEASNTVQKVIEIIQEFPNDQIVFAGLQSGGIIAMLHAWMVASSVPIVHQNLKEFKGELHQVKVFLFDSDCAFSESFARNFPIPSWDVLRFYSGMSGNVSPDRCRFESMEQLGLSYSFKPSWAEYFLSPSSIHVDRKIFLDYYDKSMAMESARKSSTDNIDNGIEEVFDEEASVAASEISMSVDGNAYQSRTAALKSSNAPTKNYELIVRPGIELLRQSMSLAKFFYNNLKDIYKSHQTFYLRRNVNGCAAAMQKNLMITLLGKERESPVVEKGIKVISCEVEAYNEKTKVSLVVCTLEGKDGAKSSILRFRTHVQNEMEALLSSKGVTTAENEWEEISISGRSVSTSESFAVSRLGQIQGQARVLTRQAEEDLFFDDRTEVTGFHEKSEKWASCLGELFRTVKHLSYISPAVFSSTYPSSSDSVMTSTEASPGKSTLSIQLPFSSVMAVCEYSLLTQPENYYQLYSVSSSMFFSIFSSTIEAYPMPPVCTGVLDSPIIPHKNSGNAETISQILNGYFNHDGTREIDQKTTIVKGLELQESITNLPSNNPYEIFNAPLCNLLADCLANNNALKKLYDCNSSLTLWAGRQHCPDVCKYRPFAPTGSGGKSSALHLCSRVIECGEGVFLGFRGCKTFGSERSLSEEFASHSLLSRFATPAYYAAFHLKNVEGWSSALKKPFRFAVFFNEAARLQFIEQSPPDGSIMAQPKQQNLESSASIVSNSQSSKMKMNQVPVYSHEDYEFERHEVQTDYYNYGYRNGQFQQKHQQHDQYDVVDDFTAVERENKQQQKKQLQDEIVGLSDKEDEKVEEEDEEDEDFDVNMTEMFYANQHEDPGYPSVITAIPNGKLPSLTDVEAEHERKDPDSEAEMVMSNEQFEANTPGYKDSNDFVIENRSVEEVLPTASELISASSNKKSSEVPVAKLESTDKDTFALLSQLDLLKTLNSASSANSKTSNNNSNKKKSKRK